MRPWTTAASACVLVVLAASVWSWSVRHDRRQALDDTSRYLVDLRAQAAEYQRLSSVQEDTLVGSKPEQDIEARIASTIRSARILPAPRYSVSVQGDRAAKAPGIDGSALREQEISIRIPGLRVQQIGAFLIAWRSNQRIWVPMSIEMIHDPRAEDDRYTLQLNCTVVYHSGGAS